MHSLILAAILSLIGSPPPSWHESLDEYRIRADEIARGIDSAARGDRPLAIATVVTFWGESRFSPLIQRGIHRGDHGKAICLGQIQRSKGESLESWEGLLDIEKCAKRTAELLKSSRFYCQSLTPKWDYPEGMVLYGTGKTCRAEETQWAGIFRERKQKYEALLARY